MAKERLSSDDYSENKPQFFKIYFPQHCSHRLRIPPAFKKYFNNVWISRAVLKTNLTKTSSLSWCVDVNKINGHHFFENGWPEFVQANSIKSEEFLVFCYNGESEFYVAIFGKNAIRKEFAYINTKRHDEHQSVLQGTQTNEQRKSKKRRKIQERENICGRTVEENSEDSSSSQFITNNPFFRKTLPASYVNSGYLNIPSDFKRSYMCKYRETARLQCSEKCWDVTLVKSSIAGYSFSGGWPKVVKENNLKVGDECIFELINKHSYVFNVVFKVKLKERKSQQKSSEISKRRRVDTNIGSASSSEIKSKLSNHPYFEVTMFPTYVSKGFLCVKSSFHKKYMLRHNATATLKQNNKSWDVSLRGFQNKAIKFCRGWNNFANDNNLQLGDVCRFELIDMNNYVFNVLIDRAPTHGK